MLKGSLFIIMAACCYGMLGTFVKLAYRDGYGTDEVTISQFSLGFITLLILSIAKKNNERAIAATNSKRIKSYIKVILAGSSLGLTSIFYYIAIQHVAVGVGIVLLVQAVWMSMIVEMIQKKEYPGFSKALAVVLILSGTIMATDALHQGSQVNWKGVAWGILAALSYTATMYSSNNVGLGFPALTRSFLMISGGFVVVLLTFFPSLNQGFSFGIFLSWGLPIALFGTILPPILFTKGMPLTGMGLGAIFISLEIPVSIVFACYVLNEPVGLTQWIGVCLILAAIVLKNVKIF